MSTGTSTTTSTAPRKTVRVGVIVGSQRVVRAGPQISEFVRHVLQVDVDDKLRARAEAETEGIPDAEGAGPGPENLDIEFETVDIATVGLPLFDEPGIPSQIKSADGYAHEHTRVWSRRVAALDAFVFVTPQYNWGVPAGLKNAIDYLFHEWSGKPALVVAYGGHGGDKAAAALLTILQGLRQRVVETPVLLQFPSREVLQLAAKGKDLGLLEPVSETWQDKRGDILRAWQELLGLLAA